MNPLQSTLTVACSVLLMGAADRMPPPARVSAAHAAANGAPAEVPPFVLFGWVSPPLERSSPERIAELAGCGLTLAMPAWADSGERADNLARLDAAAEVGARGLIVDRRLRDVRFDTPEGDSVLDNVVADYRDRPGFLGWYFTDEPAPDEFPLLARYHAALSARDPGHLVFNNLLGRGAFPTRAAWEAYVGAYADSVRPSVLCADHYDFVAGHDTGFYVEHVAGLQAMARARGLPFWNIVQLTQHGPYRALTPGELRWQVGVMLAFGARGVGYFTYWTPPPDPQWNWQPAVIDWDGTRTAWYDVLAAFNPRVRAAGETLAGLTWLATGFSGGAPAGGTAFAPDAGLRAIGGRAALGWFVGAHEQRHLLLVNRDSLATRTLDLEFEGVTTLERLGAAVGVWDEVPLAVPATGDGRASARLTLEPGDFVLLRLTETRNVEVVAGNAPRLTAQPNPARDAVRFTLDRVSDGARLEILDAGGRRVWGASPARGASVLEWRGEQERAGRAPAGIYFARLEDASGVAARRLTWLGGN